MSAAVHHLFTAQDVVSAGKMAAIGLEPVRIALGSKWPRVSGLVHALFEAAIKSSIKPGDTFFKLDELTYIVLYKDLSLQEAQEKCTALARQVCENLEGEDGLKISVRNVVGQVGRQWLTSYKNIEAAIDQALEQFGTETIIWLDDDEAETPSAPAPIIEYNFTQHARARFPARRREMSFAYRPIWDCAFEMIATYLCQPLPRGRVSTAANPGFCTLDGSDEEKAALDRSVLSHCLQRMEQARREGSHKLLAAPLHFSTLARPRAWAEFNKVYRTIPRHILCDLSFVIFALHGVPNIRLVQELPKLSGVRHVFCAFDHGHLAPERLDGTGVHAVGIEAPDQVPGDAEMSGFVKSMAVDVRNAGFEPFVFGLQKSSGVLAAMAAGVRYLEGSVIHRMVADPRFATVHGLEDLYAPRVCA